MEGNRVRERNGTGRRMMGKWRRREWMYNDEGEDEGVYEAC
jgi:hypothetical protein